MTHSEPFRGALAVTVVVIFLASFAAVSDRTPPAMVLAGEENPIAPQAGPSFTFAAAGDFGGPGDADTGALAKRLAGANVSFVLALGDLGYTSDEPAWCAFVKADFPHFELIAGNHDTTESGPGDIAQYVVDCPFTLGVPVTAGPSTPGYGYEYYFDYPAGSPLVRFILITAGVTGNLNYDYSPGSSHYNWIVNAVNDARTNGIPWVVAGMHKQCITVGAKGSCSMGQAIFDKMVDLKVDLILAAHDHVYERSKQLALGPGCATVPDAGGFDADCIVDDGADGIYGKGNGSLHVIQGTGGQSHYTVQLSGSDGEIGYFVEVMGDNANTQGKTKGYGAVTYVVTADRIDAQTDYCPSGTPDGAGQCPNELSTTFHDAFSIEAVGSTPGPGPQANFVHSPEWARVNDPVSFDASSSSDPDPNETLEVRWDWEDDGTWDTGWSPTKTAQTTYAIAGMYTVRLDVRNSAGSLDNATGTVGVDGLPPVTASTLSGTVGGAGWFVSPVGVTLSRSDDLSGVAETTYRVDGSVWQVYGGPFTVSGNGAHLIEYTSTDLAGNAEPVQSTAVAIDSQPPLTTSSLSGTLGGGGWFVSPVQVTLSSSDGLSGLAETTYRVDGGTWQVYGVPFTVSGNGTHVVDYASTDQAGNIEPIQIVSVGIDGQPPVTTSSLSGTLGGGGWFVSPVEVTLTISDGLSGVAETMYRVDGNAWQVYGGPFMISGNGTHAIEYTSTDRAGNAESIQLVSVTIGGAPAEPNPFRLEESYLGIPTFLLFLAVMVGVVLALFAYRRRRRRAQPGEPPSDDRGGLLENH